MKSLNEKLLGLVKVIKEQPTNSRMARKAKDQLVQTIQESAKLIGIVKLRQLNQTHGVGANLSKEDIEVLRLLALAETLNRLNEYDPTRAPVMAFVNYKVRSIYLTERNKLHRNQVETVGMDESITMLVSAANNKNEQERYRLLREFILEDPEEIFKQIKTTNDVTLQQILLMLLNGKKWKEIADKFKISVSTAERFFKRNINKLEIRNYFHKYLS